MGVEVKDEGLGYTLVINYKSDYLTLCDIDGTLFLQGSYYMCKL